MKKQLFSILSASIFLVIFVAACNNDRCVWVDEVKDVVTTIDTSGKTVEVYALVTKDGKDFSLLVTKPYTQVILLSAKDHNRLSSVKAGALANNSTLISLENAEIDMFQPVVPPSFYK